jgi:hypothetical protein
MTTRTMKLAGLASAIVLAATLAIQPTPSRAADECLSGPKGPAPKGSHWYYRVDRATKKNCWYVRAESKQGPSTNSSATLTLPPAETPLQPSVANARAEADPGSVGQSGGAAPEPAPFTGRTGISGQDASATDESRSTVASRWLEQTTETLTTSDPTPVASDAMPNSAAPSAAAPPVAAEMHATSSSAGFPPLLLVIVGALAIAAGVTGVIVRFRGAGRDEPDDVGREQRAPWDVMDIGATIRSPPLANEAALPPNQAVADRHAAVIPDEIVRLLSTLSKEAPA